MLHVPAAPTLNVFQGHHGVLLPTLLPRTAQVDGYLYRGRKGATAFLQPSESILASIVVGKIQADGVGPPEIIFQIFNNQ